MIWSFPTFFLCRLWCLFPFSLGGTRCPGPCWPRTCWLSDFYPWKGGLSYKLCYCSVLVFCLVHVLWAWCILIPVLLNNLYDGEDLRHFMPVMLRVWVKSVFGFGLLVANQSNYCPFLMGVFLQVGKVGVSCTQIPLLALEYEPPRWTHVLIPLYKLWICFFKLML